MDKEIVQYLITGGKWHRPTLAEISYRLAGGNESAKAEKVFVGLELIHRYLLVHDDIIDQDYVRHGAPTLEQFYSNEFKGLYPSREDKTYGPGMAMIAGDIISALAFELVNQSDLDSSILSEATRALSQLLIETAAGWKIQTKQNFMHIGEVSEADFIKGMELVSAQYSFVWPLRIGQIAAKKSWDKNLDAYGYHTGIGYQIRDDYLGMFGSEDQTGKPVGHDYREGKKTLFILRAFEKADTAEQNFLDRTLGNNPTPAEIDRAKEIIIQTGARDKVLELGEEHIRQAKIHLNKVESSDQTAQTLLAEIADMAIKRLN